MSLFEWVESSIHKMKWFDISFIKLGTAAIILMIAKLWTPLLALDWYWYGLIFILASIRPLMVLFSK